ncbi:hypothetical protein EDD15DRAFT_2192935 [Pisolithus albus]|nr:hypothetical protein EDD15DRAFT_2192935 [Pisolithus albus]
MLRSQVPAEPRIRPLCFLPLPPKKNFKGEPLPTPVVPPPEKRTRDCRVTHRTSFQVVSPRNTPCKSDVPTNYPKSDVPAVLRAPPPDSSPTCRRTTSSSTCPRYYVPLPLTQVRRADELLRVRRVHGTTCPFLCLKSDVPTNYFEFDVSTTVKPPSSDYVGLAGVPLDATSRAPSKSDVSTTVEPPSSDYVGLTGVPLDATSCSTCPRLSTPIPRYYVPLVCVVLHSTLSTMARTKQTAKKATGGKAPRVTLQALHKKKDKVSAASKRPTPKQKPCINSFCVMCRDGGALLWICDEKYCRRVVCNQCLVVPDAEKDKLEADNITFKCVTCHWKQNQANPQPYFGFYSQGLPVLAHPPLVQGTFQHATSSQVASLPTALVHLHLDGLQPYFPKGSYHFSHLAFNLTTQESLLAYEKEAMDLTHFLSSFSRVVLFLTTHSDEERGDLFSGQIDGKPVASKVSEVQCLQLLFNPLTKIVRGADIIFNVCGSVVTVQESFNDLKEVAHKFMPRSMILFDAQHLQLASTTPYLLSLLDSIIVQGFDVSQAAKFALNDCALLGRHSNIFIFMWRSEGQGVQKVEKTLGRAFASPVPPMWNHAEVGVWFCR